MSLQKLEREMAMLSKALPPDEKKLVMGLGAEQRNKGTSYLKDDEERKTAERLVATKDEARALLAKYLEYHDAATGGESERLALQREQAADPGVRGGKSVDIGSGDAVFPNTDGDSLMQDRFN